MVSEPLRAMVMGAPLWDARHQNYDCSVLRHNALRPNDGSMIRSECLESHVRDELNKTASRTMVVLHPLKVVITNLDAGLVVDHDAKKWPNVPDDDASSHYKVECWQNYRLWDFGKLHWVVEPSPAVDPLKVEVRLTGFEDLNPESKVVIPCAYGVPSLKFVEVGDTFQFERRGSTPEKLLFNRTVALPSTYKPGSNGIMDLFALVSRNGHGGEEGITRTLSLHFTAASFLMVLDHDTCSFCYNHVKSYTACICCQHVERSLKRHGTKVGHGVKSIWINNGSGDNGFG
ncbi:glutamine--tRNA ligase-like protein [Tanacetum coccineum]